MYPGSSSSPSTNTPAEESDDEEFVYPGASSDGQDTQQAASTSEAASSTVVEPGYQPMVQPAAQQASPAQLEALYAASSSGDLRLLQNLLRNARQSENVEAFALVNDASSRTGLTALHAAASRGYLDIVKWLMEECGAMADIDDKEGENALHKAALNGHMPIIKYLLPDKADVHARDADGMNAASKGHLPVVNYLLNKQSANPLVRNNWGETAYDAAAAVFEVWICEVLQKAEAEQWRGTTVPYDPLAVHTTVPLVLYENQRLDARLKTLAVSGGRPRFSASGLGRQGRRAPFELKLPKSDDAGKREVPAWRSDVHLPFLHDPFVLPPPTKEDASIQGAERSHFWLSDWTLDVTHPKVNAEEGWQYARTFQDPDEEWTAEPPPPLERLLNGGGALTAGFSGTSSVANGTRSRSGTQSAQSWVRRRRWVRVMRRRLDIPPMPFMEPDGNMYHMGSDGALVRVMNDSDSAFAEGGQEMGVMPLSGLLAAGDYVARARYLAGGEEEEGQANGAVDARRAIAKLERATMELRQGISGDVDPERKTQAEVLLDAYTRELERRRLKAGSQGLLISGSVSFRAVADSLLDVGPFEDDEDDEEEFHYPGASPSYAQSSRARSASIRSGSTDYFGRNTRGPTDLTPQLSQAPEFRVPTHEMPQKVLTPTYTPPTPHQVHAQWERDSSVAECRDCHRRFNFITRRVSGVPRIIRISG
ncbi:hypothetical protein OE88DRAFT_1622234 [Heliocybe sulcata]|uniref:Uncharacterized protein n=1 Tax=Heliocybe sulcata TaxID=5364 RepID=A0A5C3NFU8_9AGAM|nr:hypothetical protein OE88DRAFT_1622234 [Heliocybe sulcata]